MPSIRLHRIAQAMTAKFLSCSDDTVVGASTTVGTPAMALTISSELIACRKVLSMNTVVLACVHLKLRSRIVAGKHHLGFFLLRCHTLSGRQNTMKPKSTTTQEAMHPSLRRSELEKHVLPMMREYIMSYALEGGDNVDHADVLPHAHGLVKNAPEQSAIGACPPVVSPVLTHPLRAQRRQGDPSTVLVHGSAPNPTPDNGIRPHQERGTLQRLHGASTRNKPIIVNQPAPVQRSAMMKQWLEAYPIVGNAASVGQWSTSLLDALNKEVPADAPKPNPLRSAAAMHVAEAAFHALRIPKAFFEDILAAVYVSRAGMTTTHHANPSTLRDVGGGAAPVVAPDMVPQLFAFEALQDATIQRRVLGEKAVTALTQYDAMLAQTEVLVERDRLSCLTQNFAAWRCLTRQASTWRRAASIQKDAKESYGWKRVGFYSWRSFVAQSRVESELEHLQLHLEKTMEKHKGELAAQAAQFRKQIDTERRVHDEALAASKAFQLTPEQRRQHEERLLQLKQAELQQQDAKKLLTASEQKVKELTLFKEQCTSILRGTVDRVHQCIATVVGSRRLNGLRASDVLAVAHRIEVGFEASTDVASFARKGIDLVQPPLACSAQSILLAWVNLMFASGRVDVVGPSATPAAAFCPLRALGPELADCVVYCGIWRAADPTSDAPIRVMREADPAARVHLFLAELDAHVSAAGLETTTGSGGGAVRADRRRFLWSPLHLAGVAPEALLKGVPMAHTFVLYVLLKMYHARCMPNVAEQIEPLGFVAGRVSACSGDAVAVSSSGGAGSAVALDRLDDFADVLSEQCTVLHYAHRTNVAWRTLMGHVEADLFGRLSLLSTTAHDDQLLHHTSELDAAATTSAASGSVACAMLFSMSDRRLAHFTVRGVQSIVAQSRTTVTETVRIDLKAEGSSADQQTLIPHNDKVLAEENEAEQDAAEAIERISEVVPSHARRRELFIAMERYAGVLADIYCTHSGGALRLRQPQCQRLLAECGVPTLEDLPLPTEGGPAVRGPLGLGENPSFANFEDTNNNRSSGGLLARSTSGTTSGLQTNPLLATTEQVMSRYMMTVRSGGGGKAFRPLSFALMVAEMAVIVGTRAPQWHATIGTSASAARRFEAFVFHYLYCKVQRPIFNDEAFRGLHQLPHHPLSRATASEMRYGEAPTIATGVLDKGVGDVLRGVYELIPTLLKQPANNNLAAATAAPATCVSLSLDEFTKLWKELDILELSNTQRFSPADAKQIFVCMTSRAFLGEGSESTTSASVTASKGRGGGGVAAVGSPKVGMVSLELRDWIDVVGMVAAFTYPSPFFSYFGRMKAFVNERIVPPLKKKHPSLAAKISL